jgi:very-long-chain enoyl-CoA reductase
MSSIIVRYKTPSIVKCVEYLVSLDLNSSLKDQTQSIENILKCNLEKDKIKISIIKENKKIPITELNKPLKDYNFNEDDCLYLEKSSAYIDNIYPVLISYSGPIIVFLILAFKHGIFSLNIIQVLALFLCTVHYAKRLYESIYVNFYAGEKVHFLHAFGVIFYYWILYGVLVGYYIFRAEYVAPSHTPTTIIVLSSSMLYSELHNYNCHMILKELKEKSGGRRGIPVGDMFKYVSCAHYFWELMSWTHFALLVNTTTSYLFVVWSLLAMGSEALQKHKNYLRVFGDKYPKIRKAMIPYIF